MKKKIVSILIAGVLVLSSVRYAPFGIEQAFALEVEDAGDIGLKEETEESKDDTETSETSYSEEEPEYVKISGFGELPEDVVYQEVKAGTILDEIVFPDTLRIDVVPDTDREERIARKLGEERAARAKDKEEDEAAAALSSSLDEEEAGLEDSSESDEEEIIFFDSETGEAITGVIGEEENSDYSSEGSGEQETEYNHDSGSSNTVQSGSSSSGSASSGSTNVAPAVEEPAPEQPAASEETGSGSEDQGSDNSEAAPETPAPEPVQSSGDSGESTEPADKSGDLIGMIKSAFSKLTVYAAEETEDEDKASEDTSSEDKEEAEEAADESKDETSEDAGSSEDSAAEDASSETADIDPDDFVDEDGISHEMVSGVQWVLDYEKNGTDQYNPDLVGMEYVFTPILLIPDFYYIEAELPTITVKILDENFVFDETVEVDGVKIRVRADKGVFPEGSTIHAEKLVDEDEAKVSEAVNDVSDDEGIVVKSYSFDIQIHDRMGKEIEPDTEKGRVIVSFETDEIANEDLKADVYHILDEEAAAEVDPEEIVEVEKSSDEESSDAEESLDTEESLDDEASDSSYDSEGSADYEEPVSKAPLFMAAEDMVIEKLATVVVDGEDTKALEAVTSGFSKYTLTFSIADVSKDITDVSFVCLDSVIEEKVIPVSDYDQVEIISANYGSVKDYAYCAKLQDSDDNDIPDTESTGATVFDDGCYIPDEDGKWFLIIRKPFTGASKKLTLKCELTNVVTTVTKDVTLTVTQSKSTPAYYENKKYPFAVYAGDDSFVLKVHTKSDTDGVTYQWQYRKNGTKNWINIDYANTEEFGTNSLSGSATFKVNDWFRCLVNGIEGEAVQIINERGDAGKRVWVSSFGSDTQCYVSNGTVAYTVDGDVTSGDVVIDIVGQFKKNKTTYMVQTADENGWKMVSNTNAAPGMMDIDGTCTLDRLLFRFTGDPQQIHVEADLGSNEKALAIGGNTEVGDYDLSSDPYDGSLYGIQDSNKYITKLAYIGLNSVEEAQIAINSGKGTLYPAMAVVPMTERGLRVWIDDKNAQQAYEFNETGSSEVHVKGESTEYTDVKLLNENKPSGLGVSWIGQEGGVVELSFAVGTLSSVTELISTKTAKFVFNPSTSNNIAGAKLIGDELLEYANNADPSPKVSVEEVMTLKTVSSSDSEVSALKNSYPTSSSTKVTNASASSSSTSSNSNTNAFKGVDYFSLNIKETKDGSNPKEVDEVGKVLTIELSYDLTNKNSIKIMRVHDGAIQTFSEGSKGDLRYKLDKDANKITLYTSKFSGYAIGYKEDVYYTVTFDDGNTTNKVKVKSGEKVLRPADPVKEGTAFKGWYWISSSPNTKITKTNVDKASVYNFDNEVKADIYLTAGYTEATDTSKKTDGSDSDNDSRAPKTGDSLPVVWLWVVILAAGLVTFTLSLRELKNAGKHDGEPKQPPKGIRKVLLLLGIILSTTAKFIVRKLKENKTKALLTASAAAVVISAIVIATTMFQYKNAEDIYYEAEETYIADSTEGLTAEETAEREEKGYDWWDCANVNIEELQKKYPDVVGWIYFENEDISYPVMYSGDNSKYLSTAYTGEKAKAGAIFIDGESTPDFSDPHSLIYGHNMRDLSMFGKLRYYKTNPDYYNDHQYFQIFTKDSVYRYQIFACEEVPDNHDVFWVFGKEPDNYWKMLKEVENGSFIDTGIKANESDHVITLATCTNNETDRLIVSAVRTDAYNYEQ